MDEGQVSKRMHECMNGWLITLGSRNNGLAIATVLKTIPTLCDSET